jgi:plasmid stabilization system protein ParE
MKFSWSEAARADLDRLHDFLAHYSFDVADAAIESLAKAPRALLDFPRRGSRLSEFAPAEVREIRVGAYVLRYEIRVGEIRVIRLFHAREDRF